MLDERTVAALVGSGVGTVLGFVLGELREWWGRRRRRKAHWRALAAEAELCREMGETFLRDNVKAPLYRLPTLSYLHSFPVLLEGGGAAESEIRAVTEFYSQVETLNRGLDQAHDARDERQALDDEYFRNRLKAEKLVSSASYYTRLRQVLDSRGG